MNIEKRIEDLQAPLQAQLAFLRWLDKTVAVGSHRRHAMSLLDDPQLRPPLDVLISELREAEKSKSKETDDERKNRWIGQAEILAFSCSLFQDLNHTVESHLKSLNLAALSVTHELGRFEAELIQPAASIPVPLPREVSKAVRAAHNACFMPLKDFA